MRCCWTDDETWWKPFPVHIYTMCTFYLMLNMVYMINTWENPWHQLHLGPNIFLDGGIPIIKISLLWLSYLYNGNSSTVQKISLNWPSGSSPTNRISFKFQIWFEMYLFVLFSIVVWSQLNFAHSTIAVLSWQLQNFITIGSILFNLYPVIGQL